MEKIMNFSQNWQTYKRAIAISITYFFMLQSISISAQTPPPQTTQGQKPATGQPQMQGQMPPRYPAFTPDQLVDKMWQSLSSDLNWQCTQGVAEYKQICTSTGFQHTANSPCHNFWKQLNYLSSFQSPNSSCVQSMKTTNNNFQSIQPQMQGQIPPPPQMAPAGQPQPAMR
jgi:hypothetical protein